MAFPCCTSCADVAMDEELKPTLVRPAVLNSLEDNTYIAVVKGSQKNLITCLDVSDPGCIIVKDVAAPMFAEWNSKNRNQQIEMFDQLIKVNGDPCSSRALRAAQRKHGDKYGKMLGELRESVMGTEGLVQAQKAEISQLKGVVAAQETYMTAAKHKEHLEGLNQSLEKQLENARDEIADLKHQLACREEMLRQVTQDVAQTELELNRHRASSEEEKREAEERYQVLHKAMQQQQKQFSEHIQRYSQEFHQYKEKASDQMQILAILNRRLKEALRNMEEERQRFILARSKPTPRIGEEVEEELPEEPVDLDPSPVYRTDDMGMDTAWRDYKISNMELVIPASRPMPRFKVDRVRRAVPSPGTGGTGTPGSRGTPRSRPVPSQLLQLPQVAPELGTVLAPRRDS